MGKWNTTYLKQPNGCWIWQGAKYRSGYGMYKRKYAHRYFYTELTGVEIDPGNQVHHLCGTKLCVNPAHLVQLSNSEHQKLHSGGRTHCAKGHEYTEENTRWRPDGRERVCKTCHRERNRRYYVKA